MSQVLYNSNLSYLLDPLFQIENAIGKPVTGGYIIVKLAGTSTTYTTYSAFDGTQNPSKVPLDSSGRAVIIADNTQSYDVYVYDETDNLVTSRLSVVCIGSGTSSGAVYTATSPIQIINKNISHQGSGVTVGTYGDVSGNRQLNWGESFKVNTNSVNGTGHITNEFETVLTLPNLSELETNYFLGYYTGGSTFSTSAVTINFNKKDAQNISYSNGFIIPNNITLFDLSFNLYGYFQDRATATDGRHITISLYKDGTWIDSKEFYVNAYDQNIQINGNFKVKNQGNTYLLKANTDTGVFKLTQLIQVGIGSVIHVRINDETANQSINGSGSSEVYHTSSFTGNGNIDNPLTLVPASTTLLGGIKVGSNLSISSDGTLNATGGGGLSAVVHDATLTGDGTAASPLSVVGGGGGGGDSRGIPPTMDSEGYYHIYTLAQMLWVNNSLANLPEKNYKLMNDIVCNSDYSDYLSWETTPPMNEMLAAKGGCIQANYFDGNGHTIYGMYSYNDSANDAAFFGIWASGTRPTIKNVRMKNCTAIGNTTAEAIITNGTYSNICVESCLFKNLSNNAWSGSSIIEAPSYYGASIVSNVYSINCTLKGGNAYDHASLFIGQVAGEGNSATSKFFNCYENQTESTVDSFAGGFTYPVNGKNLYKQSGASWNVGGTFNLTDCAEKSTAEMKSQAFCDLLSSNAAASSYPATWSYSEGMFPYLYNWTQE